MFSFCAAVKAAMDLFLHHSSVTQRERELLKGMQLPELVAAMVGNCKITAPGMTKMVKDIKKKKKGKR